MTRPSVHDCELMELPRIYDPGGEYYTVTRRGGFAV